VRGYAFAFFDNVDNHLLSFRVEGCDDYASAKSDQYRMSEGRRCGMLWTIFVILLVLWLLGIVSAYTLGGFIHLLLVLALVVLVLQLVTGRRAAL